MYRLNFRLILVLLFLLTSCSKEYAVRQSATCSGAKEAPIESLSTDIQERLNKAQEIISIHDDEFRASVKVTIDNQPSIFGRCRSRAPHQFLSLSSKEGSLEIPDTIRLKRYWLIHSNYMWGPVTIKTNPESIPPNSLATRAESILFLEYEQEGQLKYIKSNGIEVSSVS